ncbi:MAG: hypothetical protein U5K33_09395 [Halofilum sp. (in: g-proteobacteria)]|nr:hypothetical protein [Halofilum sp. (in: g-proteobacteria)]
MPEAVVDFLEPIQVQHDHRHAVVIPLRVLDLLAQPVAHQGAVRQARQFIVIGLVHDARLALADRALHSVERGCEAAELVAAAHADRFRVVARGDALGRDEQLRTGRLTVRASQIAPTSVTTSATAASTTSRCLRGS